MLTAFSVVAEKTIWVGQGAVNQGGSRPLKHCNTCGNEIVLVQNKAGKWYPADVHHGQAGQRYYVKAHPHKCQEVMQQRQDWADQEARKDRNLEIIKQVQQTDDVDEKMRLLDSMEV